jgi:hypothetical protein
MPTSVVTLLAHRCGYISRLSASGKTIDGRLDYGVTLLGMLLWSSDFFGLTLVFSVASPVLHVFVSFIFDMLCKRSPYIDSAVFFIKLEKSSFKENFF